MVWKNVNDERDKLFQKVFEGLSTEERDILVRLLQLEAEHRGMAAPRIKVPLHELVKERIS